MKTKRHFTQEQDTWLRKNYACFSSYRDMTEKFNEVFQETNSMERVREHCNKVLHLKGKPSITRYGCKRKEQLPIGTIRVSQTATFIKVKEVPEQDHSSITGYARPYWIPLQEKIYSDRFGPVPEGNMICFLDNDRTNFNIDNLCMIDRKISAVMSSNQWWSTDPEITKTAILWCKLHYAIKSASN